MDYDDDFDNGYESDPLNHPQISIYLMTRMG